jgi:hypothetical protein
VIPTRGVGFTISGEAGRIIRDGGGELWIRPGDGGRPCTSSRPPRIYVTSSTTYRPGGMVNRVDSRIVPPWRWRLTATTALAMVGSIAWLRRKHAERRADKTRDAEVARSPLPLRPLGEDPVREGELG